jgi:hypothetical protein
MQTCRLRIVSAVCHYVIMYSVDVRRNAVALMGRGLSLRSISMSTGVNRSTLREWRDHPKTSANLHAACPRCVIVPALPEPQADYAYLLGLYLGDGCISRAGARDKDDRWYEYPRYLFSNESGDILRLCGQVLDQLGVAWRFSRRNAISVARREAVARLDEFVGPKY